MRGNQLARQWRILRTIESSKQGVTVAQLASEESCHPDTTWGALAAVQPFDFSPLLSKRYRKKNSWHPSRVFKKDKDGSLLMNMEVGGLCEVMSRVMGFGRQAEVLEAAHLRQAVVQELAVTAGRYVEEVPSAFHQGSQNP